VKITIDLPEPLFLRAKATAAAEGVTLTTLVTQAVESRLDAAPKDWRHAITNLPRVPKETLETIRLRVAGSDRDDLEFQKQSSRGQQP
jgi:hypothetical protein